jgi:hypothetical protein
MLVFLIEMQKLRGIFSIINNTSHFGFSLLLYLHWQYSRWNYCSYLLITLYHCTSLFYFFLTLHLDPWSMMKLYSEIIIQQSSSKFLQVLVCSFIIGGALIWNYIPTMKLWNYIPKEFTWTQSNRQIAVLFPKLAAYVSRLNLFIFLNLIFYFTTVVILGIVPILWR